MKRRNGEIDILRAVFVIIILIYHYHEIYQRSANYFTRGYLGVEFFFLVSGYYLAWNAQRRNTNVTNATVHYVFDKLLSIIPTYVVSLFVLCGVLIINKRIGVYSLFIELLKVPFNFSRFLTGAGSNILYLAPEWYLSVWIGVSALLYPLLICRYRNVFKYGMYVLCVIGFSYNYVTFGMISNNDAYTVIRPELIRGFSEMVIGIAVYDIHRMIISNGKNIRNNIFLTCVKYICYMIFMLNAFRYGEASDDIFAFGYLVLAFFLSVSGFSYNIPSNKYTSYVAKFSVELYLIQYPLQIFIVQRYGNDISQNGYWICMVTVIVIAMLMIPITATINRFICKEIEDFKASIYE